MKKTLTTAAVLLALALCLTVALAAGGGAGDPLVSLSYLEGLFTQTVEASLESRLDSADAAVRDSVRQRLDSPASAALTETTLKNGDALTGITGLTVIPLAGEVRLTLSSGAVVDATAGSEVPSSSLLTAGHRYIVAEASAASFAVSSATAVLSYQGSCTFSLSSDTPDYYAIASALRDLGLFRGTGSGIGQGFDLHLAPTRAEGLVMFIRILGEEADALACSYSHPFTDVPAWLDRYVAWAYHQGYTNGVSPQHFGTDMVISAVEYQEFLLRALGYSIAGVHDYTTSLTRALACGVISAGECEMLQSETFLRAHVAYISYYSLDAAVSGTQHSLAWKLEELGLFTADELSAACARVNSVRVI